MKEGAPGYSQVAGREFGMQARAVAIFTLGVCFALWPQGRADAGRPVGGQKVSEPAAIVASASNVPSTSALDGVKVGRSPGGKSVVIISVDGRSPAANFLSPGYVVDEIQLGGLLDREQQPRPGYWPYQVWSPSDFSRLAALCMPECLVRLRVSFDDGSNARQFGYTRVGNGAAFHETLDATLTRLTGYVDAVTDEYFGPAAPKPTIETERQYRAVDAGITLSTISAVNAKDMPVRLSLIRLVTVEGEVFVECQVISTAPDPITRLETTLIVYNASGKRLDSQIDETTSSVERPISLRMQRAGHVIQLSLDDIEQRHAPIVPTATPRLRLRLRIAVRDGDQVYLGATTAETATERWTNDTLIERTDKTATFYTQRPPIR
jgi:hypothetical protein